MHRAVTALAAALLALAAGAALALGQGGTGAPAEPDVPTNETLYEDGHGGRYLMGGDWYFRLDPGDLGELGNFPADPSTEGWTKTTIPNAWNATDLSDDSQRGSIGWYRKDFRVPRSGRQYGWKLRFESVNYRAKVWLNGRFLGEHEFAYIPFELPASGLVRNGEVNRLVIRVDSRRTPQDVPRGGNRANGRPTGGWWNYGGLLREVYLRRFEGVDVESVRVRPRLGASRKRAWIDIRTLLDNPTRTRRVIRLRVTVDGVVDESNPIAVGAGQTRAKFSRVLIRNPRLWQVLAPELYPVEIEAVEGDNVLSSYQLNVGIREITVGIDGLVRVNGEQVKLYGASLHEDHPLRGAALLPSDRARHMKLLRALGATITRSHYPLHPQYLELADRAGIMIWDQVPVYGFGYKGFTAPGLTEKSLAFLRAMVERDWNHASVLSWSIGNELAHRMTPDLEEYIRKAARLTHRLDPTRLRTLDIFGYPQTPPADVYQELDGLGINNYFGWYSGPNGQIEDRDLLGPYLDQMHEYYPDMALFVTEFGAEANRGGSVEEKGTYAFQQDLLKFHIETYLSKPYLNGAVAWILRDFRVRPDWEGGNPRPESPMNQKGLVDEQSKRKPSFADVAKLYGSFDPVR